MYYAYASPAAASKICFVLVDDFVCAEGNHQRGHSKTGAVQERRLWRRLLVEEKRAATGGGRRRAAHQKKKSCTS
jgi:hypothetical protein